MQVVAMQVDVEDEVLIRAVNGFVNAKNRGGWSVYMPCATRNTSSTLQRNVSLGPDVRPAEPSAFALATVELARPRRPGGTDRVHAHAFD